MASKRRGSFDDSAAGKHDVPVIKLQKTLSSDKLASTDDILSRPLTASTPVVTAGTGEVTPSEGEGVLPEVPMRRRHYAGLANQGATCYMNSLLQTLYMTPEFRRVLYDWHYDPEKDDAAEDCIPLQLQILFGKMQLTDMRSTTTTALTTSFGWTGRESFQQHDVQELARVLFDALEKSLSKTSNSQLINLLFKGTLHDIVKCQKCNQERSRVDNFLDLSLVIKPFGSDKAVASVEEALADFVKQEVLDGDNKVTCDHCNERTPSNKGLKIAEPPYILQLQLKRFVFDFETMDRQKLNDKVTFPLLLDLNAFVSGNQAANATAPETSSPDDTSPESTVPAKKSLMQQAEEMISERGPHVYELYAVLVHSGGARAGHYYAYIKDLELELEGQGQQAWRCFNDSSVSPVEEKEVLAACGGETKSAYGYLDCRSYSYSYASSANAYMLMYRRVVLGKSSESLELPGPPSEPPIRVPRTFPSDDEVPATVRESIAEEDLRAKEQEVSERKARELLRVKVHYGKESRYLQVSRKATISEATRMAWELFELEGTSPASIAAETHENATLMESESPMTACVLVPTKTIPLEKVRLRKYAAHTDTPKEPLTYTGTKLGTASNDPSDTSGSDRSLEAAGVNSYTDLMLEVNGSPDGVWAPYDPDALFVQCYVFDGSKGSFSDPMRFEVNKNGSLALLSVKVSELTGIARDRMRIMKFNTYGANPDCKEYLTNAALGLQPLSVDEVQAILSSGSKVGLPVDSMMRTVGDTLNVGTELGLRYYDTVKIYVEELPHSTVLPAFDPFNEGTVAEPASSCVREVASSQPSSATTAFATARSTPYGGVTNTSMYSITDRGLRSLAAADSAAVRAYERELNSVSWKFNKLPATVASETILLDQRITSRELYDIMAKELGIPVGDFIIRREVSSGRVIKLADDPNCLREGAWNVNRGGTLFIGLGPTPSAADFLASLVWRIPDTDIINGTHWIADSAASPSDVETSCDASSNGAGAQPTSVDTSGVAPDVLDKWFPDALSDVEVREIMAQAAKDEDMFNPQPPGTADSHFPGHQDGAFHALGQVRYSLKLPVEALYDAASKALLAKGVVLGERKLRLRVKAGLRLGATLCVGFTIGDFYQYAYDSMEFAVEVVPASTVSRGVAKPMQAHVAPRVIYVCWWDRARMRLGCRREVSVLPSETVQQLAKRLVEVPGLAARAASYLELARTMNVEQAPSSEVSNKVRLCEALQYTRIDVGKEMPHPIKLPSYKWTKMCTDDRAMNSYSVCADDGCTLVLMDADVPVRKLSKSEQCKVDGARTYDDEDAFSRSLLSATARYSVLPSNGGTSWASTARKESGIKIKTRAERDAERAGGADVDTPSPHAPSPHAAQSAVRDFLPGSVAIKREPTQAYVNPMHRRTGLTEEEKRARKEQEEKEMQDALSLDPVVAVQKAIMEEAGLEDVPVAGGMSLFDDIFSP